MMDAQIRVICPTCGEDALVPADDVVVLVWPHRVDCAWLVSHDGHTGSREAGVRVRAVLEAAGVRRMWGPLSDREIDSLTDGWDGRVPSS